MTLTNMHVLSLLLTTQIISFSKASGWGKYDFHCDQNAEHHCLNDGYCVTHQEYEGAEREYQYCQCTTHYSGQRCETHVICENYNLCANGSTCIAMPVSNKDPSLDDSLHGRRSRIDSPDNIHIEYDYSKMSNATHNIFSTKVMIDWNKFIDYVPYCDCSTANGYFNGKYCNETNATPAPIVVSTVAPIYKTDQCVNLPGMISTGDGECMCSVHWDGHICDVCNVDCESQHSRNAKCNFDAKLDDETETNVIGFVPKCYCLDGYSGKDCSIAPIPCNKNCLNGGQCKANTSDEDVQYQEYCLCENGWMGEFCDKKCPDTCENGGTCMIDSDDKEAKCVCVGGWVGTGCEICPQQTECIKSSCSSMCLNGGTCVTYNSGTSEKCSCVEGYSGVMCQTPTETCNESGFSCYNGGICVFVLEGNAENYSMECDCLSATFDNSVWSGSQCEKYEGKLNAKQVQKTNSYILLVSFICSVLVLGIGGLKYFATQRSRQIKDLTVLKNNNFSSNYIQNDTRIGKFSDSEII